MAAVVKNGYPVAVLLVLKHIKDFPDRSCGAFHHFTKSSADCGVKRLGRLAQLHIEIAHIIGLIYLVVRACEKNDWFGYIHDMSLYAGRVVPAKLLIFKYPVLGIFTLQSTEVKASAAA